MGGWCLSKTIKNESDWDFSEGSIPEWGPPEGLGTDPVLGGGEKSTGQLGQSKAPCPVPELPVWLTALCSGAGQGVTLRLSPWLVRWSQRPLGTWASAAVGHTVSGLFLFQGCCEAEA